MMNDALLIARGLVIYGKLFLASIVGERVYCAIAKF